MRRTYISPEFNTSTIFGSYNMIEESSFFGAKMLDIEDFIYISNQSIIYYQKETGEQINLPTESSLPSQIYLASESMLKYHTLKVDESQTQSQKESNTKWIIEIDLKNILSEYLFATLKKYRTFEGITNAVVKTNDVNTSIREYISQNILNRYQFYAVDLFIAYNNLISENQLKFNSNWNPNISTQNYSLNKKQINTNSDGSLAKLSFTQELSSKSFNFDYYLNIIFERI